MRAKKDSVKRKALSMKSQKAGRSKQPSHLTPHTSILTIQGNVNGARVPSRILEEQIQEAVKGGARELRIIAEGQHGIGGRIWPKGEAVKIIVEGTVGQRVGSMGMDGTEIVVKGSASDDVGWKCT